MTGPHQNFKISIESLLHYNIKEYFVQTLVTTNYHKQQFIANIFPKMKATCEKWMFQNDSFTN